jgi:hypothetical protein
VRNKNAVDFVTQITQAHASERRSGGNLDFWKKRGPWPAETRPGVLNNKRETSIFPMLETLALGERYKKTD